jgi:DNA-binding NtrC family response regulator
VLTISRGETKLMKKKRTSRPIRLLLVGEAAGCQEIREALTESGLSHTAAEAPDCEAAKKHLVNKKGVTVVLCESNLRDGTYKSILGHANQTKNKPSVIVCSRLADNEMWLKILREGGYNLVSTNPVEKGELIRIIGEAHQHCQLQRVSE